MHVLLIDFNFFAYSVSLANALAERCEVTLLLPDQAGEQFRSRVNERVHLRLFHKPRLRNPQNIATVYNLYKIIRQVKPSVVHQLSWNLWFNVSLPFFPDIPFVTTIHDAKQHPGDKESIPLFWEQQWRRAKQVVVHSESIKQQLTERDPAVSGKLNVIPHGSYDFYTHWQNNEIVEKYPTVLYFGRIWEYKGLRHLIEAEPLISAQVPNVRIVIAGYGEPIEKYEQMMVNKDHFVVHNYYIPDEMIAPLFQEASVIALPYLEASQSGVLAIAGAFGKPVVASAVGGIKEVLSHGEDGLLVPPGDSCGLAEAVTVLLKDHELRKSMGQKILAKSQGALSWSNIADQMLLVYQKAGSR